jgi:hypothetical protein
MGFKPELVTLIVAGEKTPTRREAKPGDTSLGIMFRDPEWRHQVRNGGRLRWRVGQSYALQPGRGKHAVGRIAIAAIRYCSRASDISESDARTEGFATAEEFRAVYGRLNGVAALDQACWALTIRLVPPAST